MLPQSIRYLRESEFRKVICQQFLSDMELEREANSQSADHCEAFSASTNLSNFSNRFSSSSAMTMWLVGSVLTTLVIVGTKPALSRESGNESESVVIYQRPYAQNDRVLKRGEGDNPSGRLRILR